jgi:uncharacterized membrane protein
MAALWPWFLFIHVLSAIVAFGPTFAFGIYGAQAGKEPQHGNFMARASHHVSDRLVLPVALSMPISGLLVIWTKPVDLLGNRWLLLAIAVYIVAISYVLLVQRPATTRLVELTSAPPPAGAAPAGPPPAVLETVARIRRGSMLISVLIVIIVALMVVKPTF